MIQKIKKQVTLRGIPKELWRDIELEAKRQKASINTVLLQKILSQESRKREGACAGLLSLAGTWDEARAADFERQIEGHRQIDPELWV